MPLLPTVQPAPIIPGMLGVDIPAACKCCSASAEECFVWATLHALPFYTRYAADTQWSHRRHSHDVLRVLYSSSQLFLVVVFNTSFPSHGSLESLLQPGQPLHCHYICLSLQGLELLGGENLPKGCPRNILAFWGMIRFRLVVCREVSLMYLYPLFCLWWSWVLAESVLTAGSL